MTETPVVRQKPGDKPLRAPMRAEAKAIVAARQSLSARPGRASINLEIKDNIAQQSNPHSDGTGWMIALQDAFASSSVHFANDTMIKMHGILSQCGGAGSAQVNAALALIGGIAPQDELQAAIATQIVINHTASIHMLVTALKNTNAGHFEAAASYTGMATKLSRTMTTHIEALAKLRGGGRQVIEHRYINVNAENAVVGDNTQAVFGHPKGGKKIGKSRQPHEPIALAHEPGAAMPCPEPAGEAVSVARDEGPEALSPTRRQEPRRADRQGKR